MATDLNQVRPAPAANKYDVFVHEQLKRARQRIRTLDLTTGLLGLVAGSLAFALGMALCDRWLEGHGGLSPLARAIALGVYAVAALAYLVLGVVRPLFRRINPYYAAKQVERALPGAKNSVVNWLDLHDKTLPAAIHGALGQRAAKDLAQTDLEQVISGRRALWSGVCTFVLFVACVIALFSLGPRKFFSLLERAFAPFRETVIASRTQLTLIRPEGDVTVPVGRSVPFTVRIEGRVPDASKPDAPKVLYRYQPDEPYEKQPLERESDWEWSGAMPAFQVRTGFWYKVTAGDAETPEYRVTVRSTPFVTGFEVRYHYRPYTGWGDFLTRDPHLKGLQGTEVTLTAHTNRTVKEGRLDMEQGGVNKSVPAAAVSGDREAMQFKFVLDQDGQYRITFTSEEGESNSDALAYSIQVVRDNAPQVVIVKPVEKQTPLPANGLLQVEGSASDDIGVKDITLRMQMIDGGPVLQPKVYGGGKSFKLPVGGYPKVLDYKDFVALDKVKDQGGKPYELKPGMVFEYWLEARDDCDYPKPNVNTSSHKFVKIIEPSKDEKRQEQQRKQAEQEKQKHEEQQKQKLDKENEERKQEEASKEQQNQANQQNAKQEQQPGKGEEKSPEKGKPEQKPDQGKSEPKEGGNQQQNAEQQAKAKKTKEEIDKLNQEIAKEEQQQQNQPKGESKNDCKGECKNEGQNPQPMGEKSEKGAGKEQGKKDGGEKTGENKSGGEPGQQERAEGKGAGSKGNEPMQQPAGAAKPEPADAAKGGDKGPGKGEPAGQQTPKADAKEEGKPSTGQGGAKAEQKPANPEQAKGAGVAKADEKKEGQPGSGGTAGAEKTPRDVKPEDLANLAEKAKSKDEAKKDEAARDLADLAKNAEDPKVREAAQKALEEVRKEQQAAASEPGAAKEGPKEPKGQEPKEGVPSAEGKGGGKKEGESPGEPKKGESDSGNAAQGEPKGEGKLKGQSGSGSGEKREPGQENEPGKENEQGSAKGRESTKKGEPSGGAKNAAGNRDNDAGSSPDDPLPKTTPDPENLKKPASLVLERLKKLGNDEELRKRMGKNEKQWADFLNNLNDLAQREPKAAEERLSGPKRGGTLSNLGPRGVASSDPGKKDDVKAGSAAEAPPGYEEAQRAFTRSFPDPARTPKKP